MFGKKSSEKSEKNVFLYSHEYRYQKMGATKRAKQFFQKDTNSASKKCWEKNRRKKVRKTLILYSHKYRYKIWGGKTRETIFQKHKNSAINTCWGKKSSEKSAKNVFFIFTRIS